MRKRKLVGIAVMVAWVISLLSASFIVPADVQAAEPSVAASATHGLKGEYYLNSGPSSFHFGELKATSLDPNLDFGSLETVFQLLTGQVDRVNVRWTGSIQPQYSEDYTFYMIGDNGFRLWIDNQLVIDHWVDDWDREQVSQPISLAGGQKYDFKVEYFENFGGSNLHLRWSSPSVPKSAVPTEAFFAPDGFEHGSEVSVDGSYAVVNLGSEVQQPVAADLASHLHVKAMGAEWPIASAALKEGDNSKLVLTFDYPIYSKDVWLVTADYDGNGGLTYTDGNPVPAFNKSLVNNSKFQITTPWAEQLDPNNVLPEYPRPQMARDEWLNLNGEWEFQAASEGDPVPTGQTLSERILVPFAAESKLSGIQRAEDLMWYKRSFNVPADWSGKRVKLNFGAVDYLATVYVNGQLAGSHKGGYTSFSMDITDHLISGDNELIVHVLDQTDVGQDQIVGKQTVKKLGGIWYTSISGIWQTVWLEPVAEAHIEKLDMTPDIQNKTLKLNVTAAQADGLTVEAVAYAEGQEIGRVTGAAGTELTVPVPNARLWSPDDPFLYDLKVRLLNGAAEADEVTGYFGMREIKLGTVDGVTRPLLNGEFVFQMGPLDQGYYPDGLYTAPTEDALKFDLETIKRIGMNTVRKHIKVEPARWYYWADKLGILVWQDMPSLEDRQGNRGNDITDATKAQWRQEYKEMVDQLRSVPSIIVWTVFNEGWGQFDFGGQQTRDATAYVKGLDSTRLINSTSGWWDAGAGDLIDMHAYPAPGSPTPTATRAAVLGEYGGLGLHVPGHEWSPLVFSYQLMESKEALTNRYIQFINTVKQLKNNSGLSAAIYTQITDVEYEINGLLSYDRKLEKLDFAAIALAHRDLIGTLSIGDLVQAVDEADQFLGRVQIGSGAGQYPQDAVDAYRALIETARAVSLNAGATLTEIKQALLSLVSGKTAFLSKVQDPIPADSTVDSFDSAELHPAWSIYRPDPSKWSLTEKPGTLTIQTLQGDSHEASNSIKNVFLQAAPEGDFVITTKVTAPVAKNFQQAGMLIWQDENHYVKFAHVWDTVGASGKSLESAYEINGRYLKPANMAAHPGFDTVYLQIRKEGNTYTTYFWDGAAWVQGADSITADLSNLQIGFYAFSSLDGVSIPASFDYFTYGPTAVVIPDDTAPVTTASVQPELPQGQDGWYTSDVMITLSATDEGQGVAGTVYRVDGGDWTPYADAIVIHTDGVHTVEYQSTDLAGNAEAIKSISFKLDQTAPDLKVTLHKTVMAPPYHKMNPIHAILEYDAQTTAVKLVSVTSNQPDKNGKPQFELLDAEYGTPDTQFMIVTKNAANKEVIYTVTYEAVDQAGNKKMVATEIVVPKD